MNTYEKLSQFDVEIYEVSHQKRIAVDRNVIPH
jgi:hypothetical protein